MQLTRAEDKRHQGVLWKLEAAGMDLDIHEVRGEGGR